MIDKQDKKIVDEIIKGTKKTTLREKKKAQPNAKIYFSEAEKITIVETVASKLTVPQVKIFFYQCQALGLNPLLNEICAVPYMDRQTGKSTLSIQVMRDGFLTIAHRSGKFAGIESGVYEADEKRKTMAGWAKVYHKDFEHPVYQEADFNEYNNARNTLWSTKPKTMIKKVAESMALRKAFNVSGVYASEEMELEVEKTKQEKPLAIEGGDQPATAAQLATIKALDTNEQEYFKDGQARRSIKPTKQEAANLIKDLAQKKGSKSA